MAIAEAGCHPRIRPLHVQLGNFNYVSINHGIWRDIRTNSTIVLVSLKKSEGGGEVVSIIGCEKATCELCTRRSGMLAFVEAPLSETS